MDTNDHMHAVYPQYAEYQALSPQASTDEKSLHRNWQQNKEFKFQDVEGSLLAECEHPSATICLLEDDSMTENDYPAVTATTSEPHDTAVTESLQGGQLHRIWSKEGVVALISVCGDLQIDSAEAGRSSSKWKGVAEAMHVLGHWVSATQCRVKWSSEKMAFYKYIDANKTTGRARNTYPYAEEMAEALPDNSRSNPTVLGTQAGIITSAGQPNRRSRIFVSERNGDLAEDNVAVALERNNSLMEQVLQSNSTIASAMERIATAVEDSVDVNRRLATALERFLDNQK